MFSIFNNKVPEKPQSFLEIVHEDYQTPEGFWILVVHPALKVLGWTKYFFEELAYPLKECKFVLGRTFRLGRVLKIPDKFDRMIEAINEWKDEFFKGISWKLGAKTADAYIKTSGSISLFADSIRLGKDMGLFALSCAQLFVLDLVGFLGNLGFFLSSVQGLVEHGKNLLHEEIGSVEFKFAMMKVASKVLCVAMSVFWMSAFITGAASNQLILLSISTALILLLIASRYYRKAYLEKAKNS